MSDKARPNQSHPRGGVASGPSLASVYGLTIVVAACSILYELLLAQTLSALLGNSVLRYSITIGCYLGALGVGAMICGAAPPDPWRRLARVELGLSVLGSLAVPLFYVLDELQRQLYYGDGVLAWSDSVLVAFFAATHLIIIAIGVLSGFEVPLLLAIGERRRPGSTNRVLGVDYFGALVGSVLFPTLLLPHLGLLASAFLVALINGVACVAVVIGAGGLRQPRRFLLPGFAIVFIGLALVRADAIEQRFLRAYYYPQHVSGVGDLLRPIHGARRVEHVHSAYQSIDIVRDADDESRMLIEQLSTRRRHDPAYPNDLWLYLDNDFQLFSGSDEFYHEWFAHVPVQVAGAVPKRVLILGGGDGMLLRELVKYSGVETIVHVELDPLVLELSRSHPGLTSMNHGSHGDPRVEQIEADAFTWLRRTDARFDMVYIDMPLARDYNRAMVYSREFYALVRAHLADTGLVMLAAPDGGCFGDHWEIYASTLVAAGLEAPLSVASVLSVDASRVQERLDELERYTTVIDGRRVTHEGGDARRELLERFERELEGIPEHEFIIAFASEAPTPESVVWRDFDVELDAFGPDHLELAFDWYCELPREPVAVNSIFRPTLPKLEFLSPPRAP